MARHRKQHHRKVKQDRFSGQIVAPAAESVENTPSSTLSQETAYVRKDLSLTLYTVVILLALLIIAAWLNNQHQWTTFAGAELYRWLNIR